MLSFRSLLLDVWYHVGSKDDAPGRTGFAHLFEHVMFTGSGHVPYGMHDRLTIGVGGSNGASTSNDRTNFRNIVPSNYLETVLWLESDHMGFLLDNLDEEKFKAQRDTASSSMATPTESAVTMPPSQALPPQTSSVSPINTWCIRASC